MEQRLSSLPDPLTGFQGRTVSTREQWLAERREEILEYFKRNVYGKVPSAHVLSMRSELISAEKGMDGRAVRKKVLITYEGPGGTGTLPFVLFVPTARHSVRVPAFLFMNQPRFGGGGSRTESGGADFGLRNGLSSGGMPPPCFRWKMSTRTNTTDSATGCTASSTRPARRGRKTHGERSPLGPGGRSG